VKNEQIEALLPTNNSTITDMLELLAWLPGNNRTRFWRTYSEFGFFASCLHFWYGILPCKTIENLMSLTNWIPCSPKM
jgi:hypothetical protein